MANFKYRARDRFSKLVTGITTAESKEDAAKKLKDMGYVPVSISESSDSGADAIFRRFNKVRPEEIAAFTRQLYSLQKAGVPLLASLEAIALQTKNKYFKFVIEELARSIKGGLSLSEALMRHSSIFDSIYISMIKSAEAGGRIVEILERLTGLIEQDIDTRARIKAATRYPMIAFFTLCVGFLIVVSFVIPRFAVIYSQFNTALPLPTRILIAINLAISKFWYLFILVVVFTIFAFLRFINSKAGRPIWDNFKLKIFIFGPLVSMLVMSRFARITAILLRSGLPILEILELVKNTSGNIIIARAIDNIRESVNQGRGMSEPMKVSSLFPPIVVQMVSIGEQTGKVDELLLSVADYYDRESGYMIKNLTTYIEPLLIFVLAVMVLIMALAIFMPMWNLIRVFRPS
ncbi:MAG: type II secretion system F family protein [Candidatus Omnitrophica bacterium]|nr:type II secretion system F family protein [Candidatus Omnitrophota bacterium]MDD5352137.1 type II secretion system F family protein [Candidatus Omnitrophota bacterium]MDD5549735.1 type II secretion system F family protein [Candidatus Omnitrophota bacterium]